MEMSAPADASPPTLRHGGRTSPSPMTALSHLQQTTSMRATLIECTVLFADVSPSCCSTS